MIRFVRSGVLAVLGALSLASVPARAEPQLEASGFAGVAYLSTQNQLGDSWAPEQVPGTAPVVGARLNLLGPPVFEQNGLRFQIGVELELAMAAAYTGGTAIADGGRMTYFAPIFGWRGHLFGRVLNETDYQFHMVMGAGGETVASSSPFMRKETDPVLYWGAGVGIPVGYGDWQVRGDLRHGLMPARTEGFTSTIEVQLGVSTRFGLPHKKRIIPPRKDLPPPQPIVDEHDGDGDGLPDRLDRCPSEKESVNGIADEDGCAEPDTDGDKIVGIADKCPDKAEDADGFEDDDGCPEPDNDSDGLDDVGDRCPGEAEVRNGFEDEDGCPDTLPAELAKTFASASKVVFEANRARVTDKSKKMLAQVIAVLAQFPTLKVVVIGHPAKEGVEDLARRRADAVKWHLIDDGMIEQERVESRVGDVAKSPAIELQLLVR